MVDTLFFFLVTLQYMSLRCRNILAKGITVLLLTPLISMFILILLLYIPPVQQFAVNKICHTVNSNSNFRINIEAFHFTFPLKLSVRNYNLSYNDSKIIDGEDIEISISPAALLKGEVELHYLSIENTTINSDTLIDGIKIEGEIGYLRTVARNIAIAKESADIRMFHLSDSKADITILDSEEPDSTDSSLNWVFKLRRGTVENISLNLRMPSDTLSLLAEIDNLALYDAVANLSEPLYGLRSLILKNGILSYDKGNNSTQRSPIDHISLSNINIKTGEILYSVPKVSADIKNITLRQSDYMNINNCALYATGTEDYINLHNMRLSTTHGTSATLNAFLPLKSSQESLSGKLNIHIDKRDIRGFLTDDTYSQLSPLPDSLLNIILDISGNLQKVAIDTLHTEIPTIAMLNIAGTLENILQHKELVTNINFDGKIDNIANITNTQNVADDTGSRDAQFSGTFNMQREQINASVSLNSDSSIVNAEASYNVADESFAADATVRNLHFRSILPDIPLYSASLTVSANGKGFNLFDPQTEYNCNIDVESLHYDRIQLSGINLLAKQKDSKSNIDIVSENRNLQLAFAAESHIDSTNIESRAGLNIKKARLKEIGITEEPLDAAFTLSLQGKSNLQETHSISLQGERFELQTKDRTFTPAPLWLSAATSPDTSFIRILTGDLNIDGQLSGGYKKYLKAFNEISSMFNRVQIQRDTMYFVQDFEDKLPDTNIYIKCGSKNIIANYLLFNGIKFNNIALSCRLDKERGLDAFAELYGLRKEEFTLDTIRIFARQKENVIRYFAGVRSSAINPENKKFKYYAALFGSLNDNKLISNLLFRDSNDLTALKMKLNSTFSQNGVEFHFDPQAVILNHPFSFNKSNYFSIDREGIGGDIEFTDTSGNAGIRLFASHDPLQKRKISLELFDINLQAITGIMPFVPNIGGLLNANVHYSDGDKGTFVYGDINGNNIAYEDNLIGNEDVTFAYSPNGKEKHSIALSLQHYHKKILTLYGNFNDSIVPHINGEATLNHLPLNISDAFLASSGAKFDGYIDGKISISGPIEKISSNGYIRFDSVYTDIPSLGARLHLVDDQVNIQDSKLYFKDFDIYAKGTTPFKINGSVDFATFSNPTFNLRMRAREYELINAARKKGSLLYGRLFVDLNAMIGGSLNAMNVNGSATLLGKSNITYVMQDSPLSSSNELDGLVEFVNFSDTTKNVKERQQFELGNTTMNLNLTIEEGARINADLDEGRNSYVELQGDGNLNLTYTSEDGMNLTGRYTLSNGQIKYTLPIIPLKTFNISEGSSIYWSGNIANPTLNITALERVVAPVTFDEGNTQAVAFDVGIILTNTLENMGLNFTLSAPENATVQNELNSVDKETLNKYAVTMLITGAYLGSNGNISVSNALSSFLDARINDIAGSAMKSVNINVGITDVENSESGGTYKNYSFSFSKRFLNDKLTVIIGGEVNSGDTPANANDNSFINNVSLEWKISESGNRYLRIFYDKNYESILEGEITETGVGYIYKRNMSSLKELFTFKRRNKDKKEDSKNVK